jgi:hypothetical protein
LGGIILVTVGVVLVAGTLVEDVATAGIRIADDPWTIGGGLSLIAAGAAAF